MEQFAVLSPKCGGDLRDAFEGDNTDTGRLATEFFQKCEELMNPAPAPAPALATAVIAELVEAAPGPIANLTGECWLPRVGEGLGRRPPPTLERCALSWEAQACTMPLGLSWSAEFRTALQLAAGVSPTYYY